ncbi:unnamed protein product [Oikopleura dioica]|nr:unnamed protein product [Oikopleura dioica]
MFKRCQIKDKQGVKNIQEDPEITAMLREVNVIKNKAKTAHEKKLEIITEISSKVDRYVRRCDEDLDAFKNEIEAEQPGITNQLEQRATDNTPELQRKNSVLGSDYEYDEKQFKHTTTRKKTSSASRARRPSEKDALAAASALESAAPSMLRQTSVPERGRKNSVSAVRLDRSQSVGAPPIKAMRLDPGIPTTSAMSTVEVGVDGVTRPARTKKLTPKGVQYRQAIVSKTSQLDNGFRVPLTESYNSTGSTQIVQLPSTSAMHFVQTVAAQKAGEIPDNANSSATQISPFKTLQIHPGMIQNINKVQD